MSEKPVASYLVVTYRHEYGWVAVMPDFNGATGRAEEMGPAVWKAVQAARKICAAMRELDRPLPTPADLATVRHNRVWANTYGIDWSNAIVRTISGDKLADTV